MSPLDDHLTRTTIIDCTGEISHTLVLALNGSVDIVFRDGRRANIDVRHGVNLTRNVIVSEGLLREAIAFGRSLQ